MMAALTPEQSKAVQDGLEHGRPVLHHLTGDSCWLLSIPRPSAARTKRWYHLQLDSWLSGSAKTGWLGILLILYHETPSIYKGFEEVDALCRAIERASGNELTSDERALDAILISHSNSDHFAPDVLRTYPSDMPVVASPIAVPCLKGMKHFDSISTIQPLDLDSGISDPVEALPSWLGFSWVTTPGDQQFHNYVAVVVTIDRLETSASVKRDAIVYCLHGIKPERIAPLAREDTNVLGIIHPTAHVNVFGKAFYQGYPDGLTMARVLKPDWWLANHDDPYWSWGFLYYFIKQWTVPIEEALKAEAESSGDKARDLEGTKFATVEQGYAIALA